ncbi:MAG TPA: hypothetical protein VFW80_03845 [Gaiellaceae bacterium]|nr:hypothetical protein [Gaiellaceae bacterium]
MRDQPELGASVVLGRGEDADLLEPLDLEPVECGRRRLGRDGLVKVEETDERVPGALSRQAPAQDLSWLGGRAAEALLEPGGGVARLGEAGSESRDRLGIVEARGGEGQVVRAPRIRGVIRYRWLTRGVAQPG